MKTDKMKLELFRTIEKLDDKNLKGLYDLVVQQRDESRDFWDTLSPTEKKDIEKGIKDIEAGRVKRMPEVFDKYN